MSPSCSYESCDGPGACGYDLHDGEGVAWGQEGKYSTTLFTQRARKILESHNPAERPLFLLLSLQVRWTLFSTSENPPLLSHFLLFLKPTRAPIRFHSAETGWDLWAGLTGG